jgi:hypothetical protein
MENYLESTLAFFGKEESEIHVSGKINLHVSMSLVGPGEGVEDLGKILMGLHMSQRGPRWG